MGEYPKEVPELVSLHERDREISIILSDHGPKEKIQGVIHVGGSGALHIRHHVCIMKDATTRCWHHYDRAVYAPGRWIAAGVRLEVLAVSPSSSAHIPPASRARAKTAKPNARGRKRR